VSVVVATKALQTHDTGAVLPSSERPRWAIFVIALDDCYR